MVVGGLGLGVSNRCCSRAFAVLQQDIGLKSGSISLMKIEVICVFSTVYALNCLTLMLCVSSQLGCVWMLSLPQIPEFVDKSYQA